MDPIANMLSMIRNAGLAGLDTVNIPFSKEKEAIAKVLKEENFIKDFEKKTRAGKPFIVAKLIIEKHIPKVKGVQRISKPSKRIYTKAKDIRSVRHGYGILVVTTPKGVMAGHKAKKAGLGGEKLFTIW